MLYCLEIEVNVPHDIDPDEFETLKKQETARAQELQREGKWRHLWRVAGRYASISIIDVANHDELHALITSMPMYKYLDVRVIPLSRHHSALQY